MKTLTAQDWHQKAAALIYPTGHFIDGAHDAGGSARFSVTNPATGRELCTVASGDAGTVDRAVASGRAAFRSGVWRRMAPRDRMAILQRYADLLDAHAERFALLDTLCMGKPIRDMLTIDVPSSSQTFRYFAELSDKIDGSVTSTASDAFHYILREPLGVVGCIVPWNYPLLMASWKVAPALAASVWTRDLVTAHKTVRDLEAGVIWVNCFDHGDMTQPFGGYKQSGQGRDKCLESLLSYTQTKSAWVHLG